MYIIDFCGAWENHFPLLEFTDNNSYQASIGMAQYEALCGRPFRSLSCWWDIVDWIILELDIIRETLRKVVPVHGRLQTTQDRHKSYANKRHMKLEFALEDMVFVKVSPLRNVIRFGNSRNIELRFVRPFRIMTTVGKLEYRVECPKSLASA